jgi:hypothetical protein
MNTFAKKTAISLFASAALVTGMAGTASASTPADQDGLVNVKIGDIKVKDVTVNVAAVIAAEICGLKVGPVQVLAELVDKTGDTETVCKVRHGAIKFIDN